MSPCRWRLRERRTKARLPQRRDGGRIPQDPLEAVGPSQMKLVIFDCDGTLVDSQHMIVAAMTEAYAAHGLPLPVRSKLLSIVGLSLHEAFTALGDGDPAFPVASMAEQYRAAFFALR